MLEGIVLLCFRIKLKDNWKVFLIVNFVTQVFLTLTLGVMLINSGSGFFTYLVQIPIEFIIITAEIMAYRILLKGISEGRKVAYAITANLISWFAGFAMLNYLFLFSNRFL